jgi:hypothetical protein
MGIFSGVSGRLDGDRIEGRRSRGCNGSTVASSSHSSLKNTLLIRNNVDVKINMLTQLCEAFSPLLIFGMVE